MGTKKKGMQMTKVKAKIEKGSTRAERIAYIKMTHGTQAEVVLNSGHTGRDHIVAAEVIRNKGSVLIELPQETSSGQWRVWVNKKEIIK